MPSLKHLLADLLKLGVEPEDVRISGKVYDRIVKDAEESSDEEEEG